MATVTGLKEIPASTTIKADSLYIDKKAMNVVKANLKNDMTKANDLWLNLYTITQRSVSHGVFAGQTKTTLSKLAKSAKIRAAASKTQTKNLNTKLKEATDKYELVLLTNRIAELERKLEALTRK
ncbi:MAG: hypothetical protein IKF91_06125 [Bacilli bacterium]|nr:hypothetical protein [Bacilli bacterium]